MIIVCETGSTQALALGSAASTGPCSVGSNGACGRALSSGYSEAKMKFRVGDWL